MKAFNVRRLMAAAFVFICLGVAPAPAEVKLRIYLQDGSLQSGNLVTETDESFVLVTREGRTEIPKEKIMFVNGKTLKQWEDRPDKLFQTEIIPSELPNPAFVNGKAPLPKPPVVKAVQPLPKPEPVKKEIVKVEAKPVQIPQVIPNVVENEKPSVEKKVASKNEAQKKPVVKNEHQPAKKNQVMKAKRAKAPVEKKVARAEMPLKIAPVPTVNTSSKRLQARAAKGAVHRVHGFDYLSRGDKPRAIKELLVARLFEPDHAETHFALGQLSEEYGQHNQALKYFDHYTLRKNPEAQQATASIQLFLEQSKKRELRYQIAAVAAAFSWVPVILLWRRFKPARVKAKSVDVEETASEKEIKPSWVESVEAAFKHQAEEPVPSVQEQPVAQPAPASVEKPSEPEPKPKLEPVPEVKPEPAPEPKPEPQLEPPQPVEPVLEPVIVAPAPEPEPVIQDIPIEPIAPEPTAPPPTEPEPVLASAQISPPLDPKKILATARGVENALIKANKAAEEGRYDESRKQYRTALALNPSTSTAYLGLGYLSFIDENWDVSLLFYRKALQIDPSSAEAHYGVARVLLEMNKVEDAVPELRATLTIDPTHMDAQDALTTLSKPA